MPQTGARSKRGAYNDRQKKTARVNTALGDPRIRHLRADRLPRTRLILGQEDRPYIFAYNDYRPAVATLAQRTAWKGWATLSITSAKNW